jgi:hypothetical protein
MRSMWNAWTAERYSKRVSATIKAPALTNLFPMPSFDLSLLVVDLTESSRR